MLMTDNFAVTVAVVIPVILLAAGVEARDFERASRELRTTGEIRFLSNVVSGLWTRAGIEPGMSPEEAERRLGPVVDGALRDRGLLRAAFLGNLRGKLYVVVGVVWAATVTALTVAQIWVLVWLTSSQPRPDGGLAVLCVAAVAAGIAMQFGAPVVRLLANAPDRAGVERILRDVLVDTMGEEGARDALIPADAARRAAARRDADPASPVTASPGRARLREARVRASGRVVPRRGSLPRPRTPEAGGRPARPGDGPPRT